MGIPWPIKCKNSSGIRSSSTRSSCSTRSGMRSSVGRAIPHTRFIKRIVVWFGASVQAPTRPSSAYHGFVLLVAGFLLCILQALPWLLLRAMFELHPSSREHSNSRCDEATVFFPVCFVYTAVAVHVISRRRPRACGSASAPR